ncbi:MAG: serine/threonine protein kinase [Bacilli bacterium]|nr:serine/threonine protein kinase [Bacilli bacterium]
MINKINKVINGRYRIINFITHGSMTSIYDALDIIFKRRVVIKFLDDEKNLDYIVSSAKIAFKLNSDFVIKIYELGIYENTFYIVLEYINGITLRQFIENNQKDDKKKFLEKCNIIIKICESLNFIHKNSIIHRDLKPDNIYYLPDKTIKINDFDMSIDIVDKNKTALKLSGSAYYVAPESVRFEMVSFSSDIYALGMIIYELFFSIFPFFGKKNIAEVTIEQINKEIELNNSLLPTEIINIMRKAMNKNYFERYKKVEDIKKDLEEYLSQC